jgi:3-oxoacyl-[acyl-carrier-protein] synthase-1
MSIRPVPITTFTATCAVGRGTRALREALHARRSGLRPCAFAPFADAPKLETWVGEVDGLDSIQLPEALARYDCRNQRLAWLGLQQDGFLDAARAAVARYGATRVAVIVGTSTSGILQTELAYRARDADGRLPGWFDYAGTLNNNSCPEFVAAVTGARGPAFAISTACSSSAKVFAAAERMLRIGLIDAAIVGGVDSLCFTTLCGFGALEVLSREPCRPYDRRRSGISIGEGAGFALLERDAAAPLSFLGAGESSDAHHMSTPHPQGLGAQISMRGALTQAGRAPEDVGYINLHGTATPSNDLAEGRAVAAVFGPNTPTSSTKAWFGHLLGAAGIVESVVTLLALEHGELPGTLNTSELDPECPNHLLRGNVQQPIEIALSNSFGFGGSNCSVLFGRAGRA